MFRESRLCSWNKVSNPLSSETSLDSRNFSSKFSVLGISWSNVEVTPVISWNGHNPCQQIFPWNSQHFTPLQPRGLFFSCFFLEKSRSNICEHWMTQDCSGFFFWFYPQPQEMNTVKQIYKNSKFRETSIFSRANLILRLALHTLTTSVFGMGFCFFNVSFPDSSKGREKGVSGTHEPSAWSHKSLAYWRGYICVAVCVTCCSVLQRGAAWCSVVQRLVTNCWSVGISTQVLQCAWRVAVWCSVVQCGRRRSVLRWFVTNRWATDTGIQVLQCACRVVLWCSVLQCVAACCSVLQRVAATCHKLLAYWHECCSVRDVLQCAAVRYSVMQWFVTNRWPVGMGIYMLQTAWRVAVCCSVFQHVAACCNDSWQMSGLLVWECMCCSVRDMLQCVTACCIMLQWFVTNCWCHKSLSYWNGFTCVAVCVTGCCVLQRDAVICHQSLAYWYG